MTRHVIIGASIAGLSAAEAIRDCEPSAAITLISEEAHAFYSRPGLAYLLRGDIPEKQLLARTPADERALQVTRVHARAVQVHVAERRVALSTGHSVTYDRLLLATGSVAAPPDFPGAQLTGVVKLDNLADARAIGKLAGRNKTAVVVGGGVTALELVEGLRARGLKVHYLLRGDRYWANVLDDTESRLVEERLRDEGVIIHTRAQVRQALGQRDKLIAVETQTGEKIKCDLLAVAIGVRPRLELAQAAGLRIERGLVVDDYLETSAPGVYAAGDVAQITDRVTGQPHMDVLWSTALDQGRIAGQNMAGAHVPYRRRVPMNVTQLAGLVTTLIGQVGSGRSDEDLVALSRGDSEVWRVQPDAWVLSRRDTINRVRLHIGQRQIVGALIMGDQALARPLQQLIAAQADITPIRAQLTAEPDAALQYLMQFYHQWEQAQRAT